MAVGGYNFHVVFREKRGLTVGMLRCVADGVSGKKTTGGNLRESISGECNQLVVRVKTVAKFGWGKLRGSHPVSRKESKRKDFRCYRLK